MIQADQVAPAPGTWRRGWPDRARTTVAEALGPQLAVGHQGALEKVAGRRPSGRRPARLAGEQGIGRLGAKLRRPAAGRCRRPGRRPRRPRRQAPPGPTASRCREVPYPRSASSGPARGARAFQSPMGLAERNVDGHLPRRGREVAHLDLHPHAARPGTVGMGRGPQHGQVRQRLGLGARRFELITVSAGKAEKSALVQLDR